MRINNLIEVATGYKEVTILGHDNIDVDSIVSGVLMESLLSLLGIKAKFKIIQKDIEDITLMICKELALNPSKYIVKEIDSNAPVLLVDHHITKHSKNVIGCVDHHPTDNYLNYPFVINEKASATSKIIFDLYKELNQNIGFRELMWVIGAMFVDTCSFKSSKAKDGDKDWVIESINKYGLSYEKFNDLGLCLNDLSEPVSKLSINGYKDYRYNKNFVKSSYIQLKRHNKESVDKIIDYLRKEVKQNDLSMWVFLVTAFDENTTYEYRITLNRCEQIIHNGIVARGTTIMPEIEKIYQIEKRYELY